MTKYQELQQQIKNLQAQAEAVRREEISSVVSEIRMKMAEYGLSIQDITGKGAPKQRGGTGVVAPKYRDSKGNTWSGRGKMPRWLAAEVAEGRSKDSFLINP